MSLASTYRRLTPLRLLYYTFITTTTIIGITAAPNATNPCTPGISTPFHIELGTDCCPRETTWEVVGLHDPSSQTSSETRYFSNGPYQKSWTTHDETYCLDDWERAEHGCYKFRIEDNYGEFSNYYKVWWDGKLVKVGGDFGRRDTVTFGSDCPTENPTEVPTVSRSLRPSGSPVTVAPSKASVKAPIKDVTEIVEEEDASQSEDGSGGLVAASVGCSVGGLVLVSLLMFVFVRREKKRKEVEAAAKRKRKRRRDKAPVPQISMTTSLE